MTKFEQLCNNNPVFKTIRERRSIRVFDDRDVDDDTLLALVQAAQWAPSAWDTQTTRFIIVRDKTVREKIAHAVFHIIKQTEDKDISFDQLKPYLGMDAPVQLFLCNDTRGINEERIRNVSRQNIYAAIQNLLLAAHSIGLGACWQGDPLRAKEDVQTLLNIPVGIEPISSIALGYPGENPEPTPRKHTMDEIVFYERIP